MLFHFRFLVNIGHERLIMFKKTDFEHMTSFLRVEKEQS